MTSKGFEKGLMKCRDIKGVNLIAREMDNNVIRRLVEGITVQ